jgi:hypothetical protein
MSALTDEDIAGTEFLARGAEYVWRETGIEGE